MTDVPLIDQEKPAKPNITLPTDPEAEAKRLAELDKKIVKRIEELGVEPNEGRIMVRLIMTGNKSKMGLYMPNRENQKAGENLFVARVLHGGDSKFKKGDVVVFAEYSMGGMYYDLPALLGGDIFGSDADQIENQVHIVSKYDVMAHMGGSKV